MNTATFMVEAPIRSRAIFAAEDQTFFLDCYEGEALKVIEYAIRTIDRGADQVIAMANYFPERAERYVSEHNHACRKILKRMVGMGIIKQCGRCLLYMPNVPPFTRDRFCYSCWVELR